MAQEPVRPSRRLNTSSSAAGIGSGGPVSVVVLVCLPESPAGAATARTTPQLSRTVLAPRA